ncbi:DUF3560 domain-containing protein [Brucella sp.]|uniref:DUF3560 domain-containing protein n=1 Tax=Brucella sp. TaxID=52132 RepID=UPI0028AFE0BF|nr:DUF3560 domain-containing protein [Brucella sp.]
MHIDATYSPEDDKIRLYATSRLDAETYARVKAAGFKWAPKQELFVAPKWTPAREDLAVELAGDIQAEEMTLAERAEIKAERLEELAQKRNREAASMSRYADELSQAFYMGQPILIGHHSERKARKTQERMHAAQGKSVKAEKAANYWLYRATGVECFANMKNDPRTRANRIKTLLAELRDLQRDINRAHNTLDIWAKFTTDEQIRHALGWLDSRDTMSGWETFSKVDKGELAPSEARLKCIANAENLINGPNRKRCIEHILNRLAFERSMLGDVPRFNGELTPVIIQAFAREHGAEKPKCTIADEGFYLLESPVPLPAHISENSWLELSGDEWRDVMQACGYTVPTPKPRRVSSKPAPVSLINPTPEQAEQLQRIWNLHMRAACQGQSFVTPKENAVRGITQDIYSRNSKGAYSKYETVEIGADGRRIEWKWLRMERVLSGTPVARIRIYSGGYETHKPRAVVQITDKPSKALPIDLDAIEREALAAITEKESAA